MNQIIIDNRHKIDTACQLCFRALDKYSKAMDAFQEEKHKIEAQPYVQEEQERLIAQAADKLHNTVSAYCVQIKNAVATIRDASSEMAEQLDIGEELQNALSVVKALGDKMPASIGTDLAEMFKGQRNALLMLKAAFSAAGIYTATAVFDELIANASRNLIELEAQTDRLAESTGTDMLAAYRLGQALEALAESMGVDLTQRFGDIVFDVEKMRTAATRAAMGLPV